MINSVVMVSIHQIKLNMKENGKRASLVDLEKKYLNSIIFMKENSKKA